MTMAQPAKDIKYTKFAKKTAYIDAIEIEPTRYIELYEALYGANGKPSEDLKEPGLLGYTLRRVYKKTASAVDSIYIDILINIDGKQYRLVLKTRKVLLGSGAKFPPKYINGTVPRYMGFSVKALEDAGNRDTDLFCTVNQLICDEFMTRIRPMVVRDLRASDDRTVKIFINGMLDNWNPKTDKGIPISNKARDENGEVFMFDTPLHRLRLPVVRTSGMIGRDFGGKFTPVIFDATQMSAAFKQGGRRNISDIPATAMVNDNREPLTYQNLDKVITFKSLALMTLTYDCTVSTQQGVCLQCNVTKMYINTRVSVMNRPTISSADLLDLGEQLVADEQESQQPVDDAPQAPQIAAEDVPAEVDTLDEVLAAPKVAAAAPAKPQSVSKEEADDDDDGAINVAELQKMLPRVAPKPVVGCRARR